MLKLPLENPQPDIDNFIKVIRGEVSPVRPPLAELFIDMEVVKSISISFLGRQWVDAVPDKESREAHLTNWMEVYYRLGYDYVLAVGGLDFVTAFQSTEDTAELTRGNRSWIVEGTGPISSWEDFEKYPWPDPQKADLSSYEFISKNLPEGMGFFACPNWGFLETPMELLFGYETLCYLIHDDPELVEAVFRRVAHIKIENYKQFIGLPRLCGFFQGDDMGYKTGTLISPENLRKLIFPSHKRLASLAHENGLLYMLHSCGNLDAIMDDLIDDVGIDAKHSFEDECSPVVEYKKKYGDKIALLGGIDMDKLARLPVDELRAYVRRIIESCNVGGRFALGSGNTVANYVPIPSFFSMVEECLNYG